MGLCCDRVRQVGAVDDALKNVLPGHRRGVGHRDEHELVPLGKELAAQGVEVDVIQRRAQQPVAASSDIALNTDARPAPRSRP
jgi:hypothetical protein